MMNWEAIGAVGEIIGAIAVVASLVYVGIQVHQSNILSRSQTRQSIMHLVQQELYKLIDDPTILMLLTKADISIEEKIKLNAWISSNMRQREYEWFARNDGTIDENTFNTYKALIPIVLGTERSRRWWKLARPAFYPGFAAFVDDLLGESPKNDIVEFLKEW